MALTKREGTPTLHFNAVAPKPEPEEITGRRGRKGKGGLQWAAKAADRTAAHYMKPKGGRP